MSSTASACPNCGARRTSQLSKVWTAIKIIIALVFGLIVYRCTTLSNTVADSAIAPAATISAKPAPRTAAKCSPTDFVVSGLKFRHEYEYLTFTGTVTNNGNLLCGVQLKVSTYDGKGTVVDTTDFWPARAVGGGHCGVIGKTR
jgi:hypothetical protein